MTRFARAIGSKSSNARVKADPTPWSEMAPPKSTVKRNAESIEDDEVTAPKAAPVSPPKKSAKIVKLDKTKMTPNATKKSKVSNNSKVVSNQSLEVKLENTSTSEQKDSSQDVTGVASLSSKEIDSVSQKAVKTNKKKQKPNNNKIAEAAVSNESTQGESLSGNTPEHTEVVPNDASSIPQTSEKKNKKKQKKVKSNGDTVSTTESSEITTGNKTEVQSGSSGVAESKSRKSGKKIKKKLNKVANGNSESPVKKPETQADIEESPGDKSEPSNATDQIEKSTAIDKKKKATKKQYEKNNQSKAKFARRNVNGQPQQENVEGGSQYNDQENNTGGHQMDAWGRIKKKKVMCLRCRRMGHKANECRQERKGKFCYKCGNTEHTSRECYIREEVYKFAECFICKQTGHLTRSCPNNTKGIYPHGGACFKCGENTHLAKDCPTLRKVDGDKENSTEVKQETVYVGILDSKQSADADVSESVSTTTRNKKGKKQVVKF